MLLEPMNGRELEALSSPRPIDALKWYRERTKATLKEAIAVANAAADEMGLDPFKGAFRRAPDVAEDAPLAVRVAAAVLVDGHVCCEIREFDGAVPAEWRISAAEDCSVDAPVRPWLAEIVHPGRKGWTSLGDHAGDCYPGAPCFRCRKTARRFWDQWTRDAGGVVQTDPEIRALSLELCRKKAEVDELEQVLRARLAAVGDARVHFEGSAFYEIRCTYRTGDDLPVNKHTSSMNERTPP